MSSEKPSSKDVKAAATDLGRDEFRKAYGAAAGRGPARARGRAPGLTDVASEGASGAADLAREVAGIVLRAAVGIGEQVVKAAGQLESVVVDEPGGLTYEPRTGDAAPCEPPVLRLPAVSPGDTASKTFDVRNDSLDTMDAMRLQCDGLFAHAGARIPGKSIRFTPPTVDVAPKGSAPVECTVKVPAGAKRGSYTGLIETGRTGVDLLVALTVV
jgi:hypothetical protein